jgi:hypothetical protein
LWAESQPCVFDVTARFINPGAQGRGIFQSAFLGRDQPQDNESVIRNIGERNKRSGAGIIVFQEQSLRPSRAEEAVADNPIVSCGQPPAALVASSKMQRKCHTREIAHNGVFQLDSNAEPFFQTPALRLVKGSRPRIKEQPVMRRIELNILRAAPG